MGSKQRWNYSGDMSLEHGGFFWREDGSEDYVLAVEVTPCSDAGWSDTSSATTCATSDRT